jgi:hypothetical protein
VTQLSVAAWALSSGAAGSGEGTGSEDVSNEANNPLTPKITINFQDQWASQLYDSGSSTNAFLFRGLIPVKLFGVGQLFRFTLPVSTVPTADGNTTGIGDLNLIDLIPTRFGSVEIGLGPQLTVPTATSRETGTGKWQAGLSAVVIAPQKWGLLGALATWQTSIAGESERPSVNTATVQPFFIVNLPRGWYFRSTATATFDIQHDAYALPLGAGLGHVRVLGSGTTVNLFLEPQWTLAHKGAGQPQFQLYAGVNLQFPLARGAAAAPVPAQTGTGKP